MMCIITDMVFFTYVGGPAKILYNPWIVNGADADVKVLIIAAVSADGLMGAHDGQSSMDWRSPEDGKSFGLLTREAGVMVMGSATYKTFRVKRAPPGRRLIVYTHDPASITGENVETTSEDPKTLVTRLAAEGYSALAVCGGAAIHSLFFDAGLVDELYLTVEPVIFGQGIPFARQPSNVRLRLLDATSLNTNTLLLHYAVEK